MRPILLVGHRATGKTTLASTLRPYGFDVRDLDDEIARESERSPESWVRESEPKFRMLEIETLRRLCDETSEAPRVISVGAGCLSFPLDAIVIWIHRSGWEQDALGLRERLRDDMTFQEEVAWMRANREPVWRNRAHLYVDIPEGRAPHRTTRELATLIEWALSVPMSPTARRTWVVADDRTLNRALADVETFGFAGIEVRDDLVRNPLEVPNILASVRSSDSDWLLQHPEAQLFDVDLEFVDQQIAMGVFDELTPRPLIVSCHPDRVDPLDVERLVAAARKIEQRGGWGAELIFKYAPAIETFDQLGFARALLAPLYRSGLSCTFLPQGRVAAFARPILVSQNRTNYMPATLRGGRVGGAREEVPFDLQDWLPFLTPPFPETFRALIGGSASSSQGDVWHRRRAIEAELPEAYLKVDVDATQLHSAMAQLVSLGVETFSVTAPFKTEFAFHPTEPNVVGPESMMVVDHHDLRMANTLAFRGGWIATETDSVGMMAALREIEERVEPGSIAIIGRGGVSTAVRDAIRNSDWTIAFHTGARDGWIDAPDEVTLVVNASGSVQFDGAPKSDAWLDLHYTGTKRSHDRLYFTGDTFFEHQADAQRRWWSEIEILSKP